MWCWPGSRTTGNHWCCPRRSNQEGTNGIGRKIQKKTNWGQRKVWSNFQFVQRHKWPTARARKVQQQRFSCNKKTCPSTEETQRTFSWFWKLFFMSIWSWTERRTSQSVSCFTHSKKSTRQLDAPCDRKGYLFPRKRDYI